MLTLIVDNYKLFRNSRLCQDFAEETDIHGLCRIYQGSNVVRKSLWALIVVCGLAGLVICSVVMTAIALHAEGPITVTIHPEAFAPWPNIALCPGAYFSNEAVMEAGIPGNLLVQLMILLEGYVDEYLVDKILSINYESMSRSLSIFEEELHDWMDDRNFNITSLIQRLLFKCEDFVMYCSRDEWKEILNSTECCYSRLNPITRLTEYGVCFFFMQNAPFKNKSSKDLQWGQTVSARNDLNFWVQSQSADTPFLRSSNTRGSLLFVSDRSHQIQILPLEIQANSQNLVTLSRIRIEQETNEFTPCSKKGQKSRWRCLEEASARFIVASCGCIPLIVASRIPTHDVDDHLLDPDGRLNCSHIMSNVTKKGLTFELESNKAQWTNVELSCKELKETKSTSKITTCQNDKIVGPVYGPKCTKVSQWQRCQDVFPERSRRDYWNSMCCSKCSRSKITATATYSRQAVDPEIFYLHPQNLSAVKLGDLTRITFTFSTLITSTIEQQLGQRTMANPAAVAWFIYQKLQSSLQGQMSVWLGASLVSITHCFIFFCCCCLSRKRNTFDNESSLGCCCYCCTNETDGFTTSDHYDFHDNSFSFENVDSDGNITGL